jgi:hypothetical protein
VARPTERRVDPHLGCFLFDRPTGGKSDSHKTPRDHRVEMIGGGFTYHLVWFAPVGFPTTSGLSCIPLGIYTTPQARQSALLCLSRALVVDAAVTDVKTLQELAHCGESIDVSDGLDFVVDEFLDSAEMCGCFFEVMSNALVDVILLSC